MWKTVAQMKREIKPGTRLMMTEHRGLPHGHLVGVERKVVRTNSVDIMIETVNHKGEMVESHLRWPRSADVVFTEDGFIILDHMHEPFMTYRVLPNDNEEN